MFENDVKQYGTQAPVDIFTHKLKFENDVKQYGTQADCHYLYNQILFENHVKIWYLDLM